MKLSVDTNVLIYATDPKAGAKRAIAIDLLRRAAMLNCALTEQTLVEYLNAAVVKVRQPLNDAAIIVRQWLVNFALLLPTKNVLEDTIGMLSRYKLSAWDARLLAVCDAHGCNILFSEDLQDHASYGGVRVLNPFQATNFRKVAELLTP